MPDPCGVIQTLWNGWNEGPDHLWWKLECFPGYLTSARWEFMNGYIRWPRGSDQFCCIFCGCGLARRLPLHSHCRALRALGVLHVHGHARTIFGELNITALAYADFSHTTASPGNNYINNPMHNIKSILHQLHPLHPRTNNKPPPIQQPPKLEKE